LQCASAYHHFASIDKTTSILASFLRPGGALIIVDVVHSDQAYSLMEKMKDAVPHRHGLSKEEIQKSFEAGGLTMKIFEEIPPPSDHTDYNIFLAIGEKPSA
jgi:hypothetical protein